MVATAPAKIILAGEHAVVYGQPAIAVPISSLRASATMQAHNEPFHIIAEDLDKRRIELTSGNPLAQMARNTYEALSLKAPHARMVIKSGIPLASGLGSGAAISAAIGREIADYAKVTLSPDKLNQLVYEIEKIHHGTPSGIDNTVIVYEKAIRFVRGEPIMQINNTKAFKLLIADTGQASLTKFTVGDVRKLVETESRTMLIIEQIGQLVQDVEDALAFGDHSRMGALLTRNHDLLRQLTVSNDKLDRLVHAANDSGALGAKLSGGGRGGNMIAVVTDQHLASVRRALSAAGAVRIFETTVERSAP